MNRTSFLRAVIYPYRWYLVGLVAVACYLGADVSIFSYLTKMLLDSLEQTAQGAPSTMVWVSFALYMLINTIAALCYRVYDWLLLRMKPAMERDVAQALIDHLLGHGSKFYQQELTGDIVTKVDDVAESIPELIDIVLVRLVFRVATILIGVGILCVMMPSVGLIMFVWAAGFIIAAACIMHRVHNYSEQASDMRAKANGNTTDLLGNMASVRLFTGQRYEQIRSAGIFAAWVDAVQRRDWFLFKFYFGLCGWWLVRDVTSIWLVINMFMRGSLSIGDVAFFLSLGLHFTMLLWDITQDLAKSVKLVGKISQGLTAILTPHELTDRSGARPLAVGAGTIEFNSVAFAYHASSPLFTDLSVRINPGEKVGLVGASGAGKTTFVNLVLRLYDVQQGAICIDGQDIAAVTQDSVHDAVSFIPQDPALFHRTIFDNIHYGRRAASADEVYDAARRAHADAFIAALPDGYQSNVGDRGVKLSGGQRQRIAIARAFLKQAPLIIMDEATSALDSLTERQIQESAQELMRGRTTIVIAHRLATLLTMDRILVFDAGRVVEDGSHDELLRRDGIYASLWRAQSSGFLPL